MWVYDLFRSSAIKVILFLNFNILIISFSSPVISASESPCVLNHVLSRRSINPQSGVQTNYLNLGVAWPFKFENELFWVLPAHVILESDQTIVFSCKGEQFEAELVSLSQRADLAILQPKEIIPPEILKDYQTVFELNKQSHYLAPTRVNSLISSKLGLLFPIGFNKWLWQENLSWSYDLLGFEAGLPALQRVIVLDDLASPPSTSGSLVSLVPKYKSPLVTTRELSKWGMLIQTEHFGKRSVVIDFEDILKFTSSLNRVERHLKSKEKVSFEIASYYERSSSSKLVLVDNDLQYLEIFEPCSPSTRVVSEWSDVGGGSWGNGGGGSWGNGGALISSEKTDLPRIVNHILKENFAKTYQDTRSKVQFFFDHPRCFDDGLIIKRVIKETGETEVSRMLIKPRGKGWHRPLLSSFTQKDLEQIIFKKFGRNQGDYSLSSNLLDYVIPDNSINTYSFVFDIMCRELNGMKFALDYFHQSQLHSLIGKNSIEYTELMFTNNPEIKDLKNSTNVESHCLQDQNSLVFKLPGPDAVEFKLFVHFGEKVYLEVYEHGSLVGSIQTKQLKGWSQGSSFVSASENLDVDFFFELFPPFHESKSPVLKLKFLKLDIGKKNYGPLQVIVKQ